MRGQEQLGKVVALSGVNGCDMKAEPVQYQPAEQLPVGAAKPSTENKNNKNINNNNHRTALEKCTHLCDDTQGTIKNTSAFDTESSSGVRREIEK